MEKDRHHSHRSEAAVRMLHKNITHTLGFEWNWHQEFKNIMHVWLDDAAASGWLHGESWEAYPSNSKSLQ